MMEVKTRLRRRLGVTLTCLLMAVGLVQLSALVSMPIQICSTRRAARAMECVFTSQRPGILQTKVREASASLRTSDVKSEGWRAQSAS